MDTSLKVLKKILEKYSVESIYSDEDGAVWMNKLIPNNQTIIVIFSWFSSLTFLSY